MASFWLNEIRAEARDAARRVLGIKEERACLATRAACSFDIVFALASTRLDIALVVITNCSALVALAFFTVGKSVVPGKAPVTAFSGDKWKTSALAVVIIAAFRCANSSFGIAIAELASLKIIIYT